MPPFDTLNLSFEHIIKILFMGSFLASSASAGMRKDAEMFIAITFSLSIAHMLTFLLYLETSWDCNCMTTDGMPLALLFFFQALMLMLWIIGFALKKIQQARFISWIWLVFLLSSTIQIILKLSDHFNYEYDGWDVEKSKRPLDLLIPVIWIFFCAAALSTLRRWNKFTA